MNKTKGCLIANFATVPYYFRVGIVMTLPVLFVTLAALALRLSV
ncbi:TPA: hypothetical protein ACQ44P_005323 [Klebsiella pneumoniae]